MGSFLVPGYLRLKNPYRWKMDAIGPCSSFTNMLQRHLDVHSWIHFHSLAFKHDCALAIDKHYKNYILPNMTIFIFFISPRKERLWSNQNESHFGFRAHKQNQQLPRPQLWIILHQGHHRWQRHHQQQEHLRWRRRRGA